MRFLPLRYFLRRKLLATYSDATDFASKPPDGGGGRAHGADGALRGNTVRADRGRLRGRGRGPRTCAEAGIDAGALAG